ncbi:MAG: hypothetical protein JWN04_218 [Myxococcaceae bacterium]|nr:hypothetical protein [Myxococcaceae bacterium]
MDPNALPPKSKVGQLIYDEIEKLLSRRTTPEDTAARRLEELGKSAAASVWNVAKRHSGTGVVAIGAATIVIAELTGAAELAFGIAAGYAAFRVLKRGDSPEAALEKVLHSEP